jgi:beta-glucanase (GH16 family)
VNSLRRSDLASGEVLIVLLLLYLGATILTTPFVPSDRPSAQIVEPDSTTCDPKHVELDYSRAGLGELAWADEFDGDRVDTRRWTVRDRTKLSFDQAIIRSRNVSVHDGALVIEARRETMRGRDYTTGYLDSIGHFSQRHGRWEIRARLPVTAGASRGLWPAFWLRADHAPGEIDVMEAWGTPADHPQTGPARYAWNVHEDTMAVPGSGSGRFQGWGTTPGATSLAEGFHVFAVDWSPECLRFTLDGRVTGSVAMDAADWLSRSLRGTVNIRLNLQVGSHYWGRVDPSRPELTQLPARLVVDYVRVFERR